MTPTPCRLFTIVGLCLAALMTVSACSNDGHRSSSGPRTTHVPTPVSDDFLAGLAGDLRKLEGIEPGSYLHWDVAASHVGENQRVCGPVDSVRIDVTDVHVTLGRGGAEFEVVVWDAPALAEQWASKDAQPEVVCIRGKIVREYGTAQIQTRRPRDLWSL